jgi:hypothetical protein
MNQLHHHLSLLVAVVILASLISGCGEDEPSSEPPAELEDQLGFGDEGIVERQARVEGVIQECMKAQGFDYVPVDPLAQRAALTGKARMTDEEFLEQFGYGISTMFGRGNQTSNPNDSYRKSLSPADRAAYERALWGETPGLTFAEAVDNDLADELGGCTKRATATVFGGAALLATLQGKFDELEERIVQDQRMVRAVERWSRCMADEGYQYEEPEEIDTDLIKRFQEILGTGVRPGATAPPTRGSTFDRAALADLQRAEVRIARADLACEKKHITPVELEVRPKYEETFRKQNRRLISQVRPVGQ